MVWIGQWQISYVKTWNSSFLYLHTLFFDKFPLLLDSKKTKFSSIHQTWPSPEASFDPLQKLLSQSTSSKSLPSFLLLLPFDSTAWEKDRAANQPLPHSLLQMGSGHTGKLKHPCHTTWWGPDILHPCQLHHSMHFSYPVVPKHVCQAHFFMAAPGRRRHQLHVLKSPFKSHATLSGTPEAGERCRESRASTLHTPTKRRKETGPDA